MHIHKYTTTKSSTIHWNKSPLLQKILSILMMRHYCLCIYYASTLTRLHLTATIPGTWVSRNKNVKPVWVYCSKRRWKWQCAMGTLGHAKLQSEHHQQQTQHSVFCRPDALPATQPRLSRHWRQICIHYSAIFPSNQHLHHYRDQWKVLRGDATIMRWL